MNPLSESLSCEKFRKTWEKFSQTWYFLYQTFEKGRA